jgi:ferredoxin
LKVTVDRERCQGSGSCLFHAPNTFDQDDETKVVLLDTRDNDDAIRAAAHACPSGAITIEEGE